jgi:hypothetical protein
VFAFPNVFHFLAHKLPSLSAGRLAFALVLARAFNYFVFWHNKMVSPLEARLDVINNGTYRRAGIASQLFICARAFRAAAIESLILVAERLMFASLSDF